MSKDGVTRGTSTSTRVEGFFLLGGFARGGKKLKHPKHCFAWRTLATARSSDGCCKMQPPGCGRTIRNAAPINPGGLVGNTGAPG